MSNHELHVLLVRLDEALQRTPELDAESRRLLATVAARASATPATHVPAIERLAVHFESDHPAVAAAARALLDALAKAGI